MRIKPESWSPDPEKKGPGTRADRASAHAAARIKARHAERDYFGRPIYKDEPKVEGTPAAIKRVRTGTVTYAVRDTDLDDLHINEGDIIGLYNGQIHTVGSSIHDVTRDLMNIYVLAKQPEDNNNE